MQTIGDEFFVAPSASVIGRVFLGRHANVWFGAVLRGDVNDIRIGDNTNVQDTAVIHVDSDAPCTIGNNVTIGHGAIVHGCTVGDFSLIGIGSTILSHAVIGKYCLVGAGALITERKVFADRSLIIGAPARRARELTDDGVPRAREKRRGLRRARPAVPPRARRARAIALDAAGRGGAACSSSGRRARTATRRCRRIPSEARICSYECTFCITCVETVLENVCPNCGGGFVPRPDQAGDRTGEATTSSARIPRARRVKHRPVDAAAHARFAAKIKDIPPRER